MGGYFTDNQKSDQEKLRYEKGNQNRSRNSKKYREYNGQMIKDKRTNNDLQNTTPKTKDWATGTLLKTGVISCALEE